MAQHNEKNTKKNSTHSITKQIKDASQKAWYTLVEFEKRYWPKLKKQAMLGWHKLMTIIEIYGPKVKDAILSFAHIYGRKSKEAIIAFRKNYEPKIKEQASILGTKTIDFANELKKKINKS